MRPSLKDIEVVLKPKPLVFGLTLQNIPTINLRQQYAHDRKIAFTDDLATYMHAWEFGRAAPMTVTYAGPDSYFTVLLRSTIVGVECTLEASAIEELAFSSRLTEMLRHAIRNPTSMARSIPDAYFNKVPEKVDPKVGLRTRDGRLWNLVQQFYREIRNPIFHGYELSDVKAESLQQVFGMFDQIYEWIDSWSDPHRLRKLLSSVTLEIMK